MATILSSIFSPVFCIFTIHLGDINFCCCCCSKLTKLYFVLRLEKNLKLDILLCMLHAYILFE